MVKVVTLSIAEVDIGIVLQLRTPAYHRDRLGYYHGW